MLHCGERQEDPKKMEHSTEEDIKVSLMHVPLRPDEYQVCEIFIQLPHLIAQSESRHKFPISWGAKRRRSVSSSSTDSIPPINRVFISSSSPLFLPNSAAQASSSDMEEDTSKNDDASSPSTPLAFSPSESDDNKCSIKMELENKSRGYERLKAFNIELIARKQEPSCGQRRGETHLVIGSLNLSVESKSPVIDLNQSQFINAHKCLKIPTNSEVDAVNQKPWCYGRIDADLQA